MLHVGKRLQLILVSVPERKVGRNKINSFAVKLPLDQAVALLPLVQAGAIDSIAPSNTAKVSNIDVINNDINNKHDDTPRRG